MSGRVAVFNDREDFVLILVVMEYTQWDVPTDKLDYFSIGLNPCCNGIYSMRTE